MPESACHAVFLSYASQDAEAALRICEALRAAGVEVWFDQNELVGGDAWDAKIRKQIAECALFVPVISAATQARLEGYFRLEWKLAAQRTHMMAEAKSFLVPVAIDTTRDADAHVPAEFKAVQWTRLRAAGFGGQAPNDPAVEAFCARVQRLLGGGEEERGPSRAPRRDEGGASPAMSPVRRRVPLATWMTVGVVLTTALFGIWWTWGRESDAAAGGATARKPVSETQVLLAKVRALRAKADVTRAELDTATGWLETANKLDANDAEVWAEWALVECHYANELLDSSDARRESARQKAMRAAGLKPASVRARFAQAAVLATMGRYQSTARAAVLPLVEPLAAAPDAEPEVLFLMSWAMRDTKQPEGSFAPLDRAGRVPGLAGAIWFEKAVALVFAGRWGEADEALSKALAVEPAIKFRLWKAYVQVMWHGDVPTATRMIADLPAVSLSEDLPAAACYWIYLWARDWDRALAMMRGVPRDFIDSGALTGPTGYFRGFALARAGKRAAADAEWRAALAVVERSLMARPNDRGLLASKTLLYVSLGQKEDADRWWRTLRELYGDGPASWTEDFLNMEYLPVDEVIARVELQVESNPFMTMARLRLDPYLDRCRTHPKFVELLARAASNPRISPRDEGSPKPVAATVTVAEKSVAVLAFANLSDDKANEYFSSGISEELSYVLGRIEGLKVVAGSSGAYFKGRDATPQEKGRLLGVNHLVEGSVARDGQDLRVIARVTSVQTGAQLWTDKFTGPANKPWDLQEEIARKVAKEFSLKLGATGRAGATINPEAHRLHLEARHFWGLRSFEGFDRAEACYLQALALEPESALLHAGLADVAVMRGWYAETNGPANVAEYDRARRASERAIKLDPELSDAYAAPTILAFSDRNWPEAERLARKAIVLAPNNAAAHDRLGDFGAWTGRLDVALEGYGEAARLDPLSIYIQRDLVHTLLHAQRYEEVIATTNRARQVWPADARLEMWRAWALHRKGREEDAVATLRARVTDLESEQLTDIIRAAAIFYLRTLGLKPEAEELRQRMLARLSGDNYLRGFVFAASGDLAAFLPFLPRSAPAAGNRLFWGPEFDAWRENRQFLDAVAQSPFAQEYTRGRETLRRTTAGKAGNP